MEELKKNWYTKRKWTSALVILIKCFTSFETTGITISALYYYRDDIKVPNPRFYYGMCMSSTFFAGMISIIWCGKYLDKTRNTKRLFLVMMTLGTLGNIMYTFTFWRWCPILGRFVSGLKDGAKEVIPGELSRVYNKRQLGTILSKYEIFGIFCSSIAPCAPLMFYGIDFNIGLWKLNQNNFIGLFLAVAYTALGFACYFGLSNLTIESAFKYVEKEVFDTDGMVDNGQKSIDGIDSKRCDPKQRLWSTKDIIARFDVFLLLIAEAFIAFLYFQLELMTNLTAIFQFSWPLKTIGIVTSINVILGSAAAYFVQKKFLNNKKNIYFLFLSSFVLINLMFSILHLTVVVEPTNPIVKIALLAVVVFFNMFQCSGSTVYFRLLIFSISPSHSASIIESHRFFMARSLSFVGFLISGYVYPVLWIILPIYCGICYFFITVFSTKTHLYLQ